MNKLGVIFLLILFVFCQTLFAQVTAQSLLENSLENATEEELRIMASSWNITPTEGTSLKEQLKKKVFQLDEVALALEEENQESKEKLFDLKIISCDNMRYENNLIILTGTVELEFSTEGTKRGLVAAKVVIDVDNKLLVASGSVTLTEGEDSGRTFVGELISLNWESLDIKVSGGISSSTRENNEGQDVEFFASGDSISYLGGESAVVFDNGFIATSAQDPYWSIRAKKIGILGGDLFLEFATIRLGRIPIAWVPVFFYPGTKLSFNPAIGLSSTKGAFINTTMELYGTYKPVKSSGNAGDSGVSSFSTLLKSEEEGTMIRDGFIYRSMKEGETLTQIEDWAQQSSSYFAIFADAYEEKGLMLGFDTANVFWDGILDLDATGFIALDKNNPFKTNFDKKRFSLDLNLDLSVKNASLSVKMPLFSDPEARYDYLNRNTDFTLDSVFGKEQQFPKTFTSGLQSYTWSLDGRVNVGSHSLTIGADLAYKWKEKDRIYSYVLDNATLPSVSISSQGVFTDFKFGVRKAEEKSKIEEFEGLKPYEFPKAVSSSGSFKAGYTLTENLTDRYSNYMEDKILKNLTSGSLYTNLAMPGQWFSFSETVKPRVEVSLEDEKRIDTVRLESILSASIPKIGLTYNLNQRLYTYQKDSSGRTDLVNDWGKWDDSNVSVHNIELKKTVSSFTFSATQTLWPLTLAFKPTVSWTANGIALTSTSTITDFNDKFTLTLTSLDAKWQTSFLNFGMKGIYDLTKNGWDGLSFSQNSSISLFESQLKLSQNFKASKKFVPTSLDLNLSYKSSYVKFTWAGEKLEADTLFVKLAWNQDPVYAWKNRIGFDTAVDFDFSYDFANKYGASFAVTFDFGFAIAEFLDLKVSVKSKNNSFYRYFDEQDKFDLSSLFEDLARSFDFFGDGRHNTGFNLSDLSIEAVHYMRDWNLCCKATTSVVLSDRRWILQPQVTVFIRWNAIPELEVEREWKSGEMIGE